MTASKPALMLCKKLLIRRCLNAVGISLAIQFLLFSVFLLFANFHIFHPINWITSTFGLVFSFYTWLSMVPLVTAVLFYGVLLGKMFMVEKHYYPTRYHWLLGNALRQLMFLLAHVLVGFFTAWLYTKYLHVDYRHLIHNCNEQTCINSHYTFLISLGVFAATLQFVKSHLRKEVRPDFVLAQEKCVMRIRFLIRATLFDSPYESFTPTLIFALCYWIFGRLLNTLVAQIFAAKEDERLENLFAIAFNIRLLFYAWMLASHIMSNMYMMQHFYVVLLVKPLSFAITKKRMPCDDNSELTLVEALGTPKVYLIQQLAAQCLHELSFKVSPAQRLEIFQLSEPGNHPVNWKQLCGQCISIIQAFTEELTESMKHISAMKNSQVYMPSISPNAQAIAEKILLRQYNDKHGIRPIVSPVTQPVSSKNQRCATNLLPATNCCQRLNARCEEITCQLQTTFHNFVRSIPGISYFFGEPDGAKTIFLLDESLLIVWLALSLAGICVASLTEDRFGVVQTDLLDIIKALVNLKTEVDKLNNININGKRLDHNFHTLKLSLKRCLVLICSAFGDYMREVIPDPQLLRQVQIILNTQES